jgi:transcriptional regulator with XRE-family HTH domain
MNVVKLLRRSAGVTQTDLAKRAGTSQPTVAAYEAGSKSPTLRTLERLAAAVGRSVVVSFVPALTREDRRSLWLHRAIADKLRREPDATLERAHRNLERMMVQHSGAEPLLSEWVRILGLPVDRIVDVMVDAGVHARDLRQVTPFAGVLSASERARAYREFAERETRR